MLTSTSKDEEKLRVDFNFQVAYPSWLLEQHWMDAIGILNEKYNAGDGNDGFIFSAYQWYKNGEELVGQTRPYLYMPHLLEPGAEYSVGLVREGEEERVMTCPIVAQKRDNTTMPQLPYVMPNHYSARIYFDNGTCEDEEKLRVDFNFQVHINSITRSAH